MSPTEARIKALEVALENEMRERDFYLKQKERTNNPLGQRMFASIAADEDEHYRRILELHDRLRKEGKWPESLPLKVKGTEIKKILQEMVAPVALSSKADTDDLEAVQVAIAFETKGELFYKDLARRVEVPVEKDFYGLLASMEREHRLSLEDTYEYFQDPAGWHQRKEKPHIDAGG